LQLSLSSVVVSVVVGFGAVVFRTLQQDRTAVELAGIAARDFMTATEQTTLSDIIDRLHAMRASLVLVTDGTGSLSADKVKGVITKGELADAMVETADLYRG
jgi:CBS domain-containing protein